MLSISLILAVMAVQSGEVEVTIGRLIKQLGDESATKRDEAAQQLRKIGVAAMNQLESATSDNDAERRSRSRKVLSEIRISRILAEIDTGLLKADCLQAEVLYSQGRYLRGTYQHEQGGKKFSLRFERPQDPKAEFKLPYTPTWSVLSDGEVVLQTHNFGTASGEKLYTRFTSAGFEKRDLGRWSHHGMTFLPPPRVIRLVRLSTTFDTLREDLVDDQSVWVLEGDVPEEMSTGMTYSGFRSTHSGTLRPDAEEAMRVRRARLMVAKSNGLVLKAEGLQRDGTPQWFLNLRKIRLDPQPDPSEYKVAVPKDAVVLPGD